MQFRSAKRTETAHTGMWRGTLEPGDWKKFSKHPKFQFTHTLTMNSRHNLTKSTFSAMLHRQCKVNGVCKLKSCYHLRGKRCCAWAAVCTQILRVSVIMLRYWALKGTEIWREVCSHININDLHLFFWLFALEYWCLGVSLLSGVLGKLIWAVSVRRQLAEKERPVIRKYVTPSWWYM